MGSINRRRDSRDISSSSTRRSRRNVSQALLQKLIEHSQKIQWDRPRANARTTWMEVMRLSDVRNPQTTRLADWARLRPRHWIEAGLQTASQHASGSLPGVWCADGGYVQHVTGSYASELSFESPLAGKFELSFDCREGGWSEGNSGYGDGQFQISGYANSVSLTGKGHSGYESGPNMANLLHKSPWNRYTIQVDGGVVRYFANGQFVFEDKLGASAPWLTLGADWGRTPIFRNFKLTGTPTIPRELPLLTNARLRGWVTSQFGESRSDALREPRRFVQQTVEWNGETNSTVVEADETSFDQAIASPESETDWQFGNGELTSSRREEFWPGAIESWLMYQRPLREGDSLRYEFFHQPSQTDAAYELLDRIQRKQLQTGKPGDPDYGRFVRQLHGQVQYLMHGGASEEFGTQPRTKQWRMVPQASAKSRGEGYPIASFDTFTGEMAIRGGHDFDMAYFQSPLLGNYEVSCRLSNIWYRETMLMAAGIANSTRFTYTETRLMHVRTNIENVATPAPISPSVPNESPSFRIPNFPTPRRSTSPARSSTPRTSRITGKPRPSPSSSSPLSPACVSSFRPV